MNILGINAYHGKPSAALVVDGPACRRGRGRAVHAPQARHQLSLPLHPLNASGPPSAPEVPIEFTRRPKNDPQVRRPDISLAGLELGWEPKVPLDTGLERMVAWVSEAWTT